MMTDRLRKRDPSKKSWAEPWKIKMVEPIRLTTRPERETLRSYRCQVEIDWFPNGVDSAASRPLDTANIGLTA